jgi:hypothetical protein
VFAFQVPESSASSFFRAISSVVPKIEAKGVESPSVMFLDDHHARTIWTQAFYLTQMSQPSGRSVEVIDIVMGHYE